jgi:hypothetical protein
LSTQIGTQEEPEYSAICAVVVGTLQRRPVGRPSTEHHRNTGLHDRVEWGVARIYYSNMG